jgi:hypothetical protein
MKGGRRNVNVEVNVAVFRKEKKWVVETIFQVLHERKKEEETWRKIAIKTSLKFHSASPEVVIFFWSTELLYFCSLNSFICLHFTTGTIGTITFNNLKILMINWFISFKMFCFLNPIFQFRQLKKYIDDKSFKLKIFCICCNKCFQKYFADFRARLLTPRARPRKFFNVPNG